MQPTYLMSMKVAWSVYWRFMVVGMLFGLSVMLGFMLLAFLLPSLILLWVWMVILAYVVGLLYINRWVMNQLPALPYKEGRIALMKEQMRIMKFGVFDALCVLWSQYWRVLVIQLIISIPFMIFASSFVFFMITGDSGSVSYTEFFLVQNTAISLMVFIIGQILMFLLYALSFHWMMHRKHRGRWLKVCEQNDMMMDEEMPQSCSLDRKK